MLALQECYRISGMCGLGFLECYVILRICDPPSMECPNGMSLPLFAYSEGTSKEC